MCIYVYALKIIKIYIYREREIVYINNLHTCNQVCIFPLTQNDLWEKLSSWRHCPMIFQDLPGAPLSEVAKHDQKANVVIEGADLAVPLQLLG
jgi:hypothetical protein